MSVISFLRGLGANARPIMVSETEPLPVSGALSNGGSAVSSTNPLPITTQQLNPSYTLTRVGDTNAYAAGDAMGVSVTAGSVVPGTFTVALANAGKFEIVGGFFYKSGVSLTSAQFRLHLWTTNITPTSGDNAAMTLPSVATYLGFLDVTCDKVHGDGASGPLYIQGNRPSIQGVCGASVTVIYGLFEAVAAYSGASAETFTATLYVVPK